MCAQGRWVGRVNGAVAQSGKPKAEEVPNESPLLPLVCQTKKNTHG
jgi:hypothetical protein